MKKTQIALACLLLSIANPRGALAHGDVHEQIEQISARLKQEPYDARLFHKRAELYRADGNYPAALRDYERAQRLDPNLEVVHLSRGRALLEAGRPEPARRALSRFLSAQPAHQEARLLRARAFVALHRRAEAEADFRSVLATSADPLPDVFLERAENLVQAREAASALAALEEGRRRLGDIVTLEHAALELEVTLGRFDAALSRVDRLLAQSARKEHLLARKADILARAGRVAEAEQVRREALAALESLPGAKRELASTKQLEQELRVELEAR